VQYGGNFHAAALAGNPQTQSYLYETWHSTTTPDWRGRLNTDLPKWLSIVDGINAAHEGADMLLVPAGQALGLLVDAIAAGTVPGVTSRDALFSDDIHLTPLGNYFVALVHYATLYRRSPVGLTGETVGRFAEQFPTVPPATAARLQEIAWQGVTSTPRSGVPAH
jgi:hypothetical protein